MCLLSLPQLDFLSAVCARSSFDVSQEITLALITLTYGTWKCARLRPADSCGSGQSSARFQSREQSAAPPIENYRQKDACADLQTVHMIVAGGGLEEQMAGNSTVRLYLTYHQPISQAGSYSNREAGRVRRRRLSIRWMFGCIRAR